MLAGFSLWLLSLGCLGNASVLIARSGAIQATPTVKGRDDSAIHAIVPTSSGQIGINPVESDLGDPDTYIGEIYGQDTNYITLQDTTTAWIGVNSEYLSMDGTSTVQVVIATATAAANGQNVGDVSIILPQALAGALQNSVEAAVTACGDVVGTARRDAANLARQADAALSCAFQYAEIDTEEGGLFDLYIAAQTWVEFGFQVAPDAPAVLKSFIASLGSEEAAKAVIWLAIYSIVRVLVQYQRLSGTTEALSPVGKINIPAAGFAAPPPKTECTGTEPLTIDSLLCRENQCQGGDSGFCTQDPNIACPCIITTPSGPGAQPWDQSWFEYQQLWLLDVFNGADPPEGPCVPVGDNFDSQLMFRILPLGASIVFGTDSTDLNGFREDLRLKLIDNGAKVNYVGSVQSGTMLDNDVEAWPGYRIDQVAVKAENALPWLPNLVIIHIGTNDALQNYKISTAHERLGSLIDRILSAVPGTIVLISTLIPNLDAATEANIEIINSNIPSMVEERANAGKLVYLVDMHNGYITDADLNRTDGTHPTDEGYVKMANVWYAGIQQISATCWLTPPGFVAGLNDTVGSTIDTKCEKIPGNSIGPIKTQQGSGFDDGIYQHTATVLGQLNIYLPSNGFDYDAAGVMWADIDGDGIDDFVYVGDNEILGVALNNGTGVNGFGAFYQYATDMYCLRRGVRFGDLNGDGRDDFFCVSYPDGALWAWQNTPGLDPRDPIWVPLGIIKPAEPGYAQSQIQLGDIDGDGRVDYLGVAPNGEVTAWRNGGQGVAPAFWQNLGVVFDGSALGDIAGIRFVDINGDGKVPAIPKGTFESVNTSLGREDCLWVSNTGQVTTYINQRGSDLSMVPVWQDAGITHSGVQTGVTNRSEVIFGKIWNHQEINSWPDYHAVGADYSTAVNVSAPVGISPILTYLPISLWVNGGAGGGARQKGDGDRYCDMRGTGSDDYVWMAKDGTLILYANNHNPPYWGQYGTIYTPGGGLMAGRVRKDLHLADLNGDGKCDFLIVDRKNGSVRMIRNDYSSNTDTFAWTDMGIVSDGVDCGNSYGVGLFDMGVRFADIDGDGRADYLCIDLDGRTTAWLNKGLNNFVSQGQVKHTEGADRANIRFADVNGDGRADYLWLDKFTGKITAWTNEGPKDPAKNDGSTIFWQSQGVIAEGGSLRGECINFANLKGEGRADYLYVYPQTSIAYVYFNVCPSGSNPPMEILPPLPGDPYLKRTESPLSRGIRGMNDWSANGSYEESFARRMRV